MYATIVQSNHGEKVEGNEIFHPTHKIKERQPCDNVYYMTYINYGKMS